MKFIFISILEKQDRDDRGVRYGPNAGHAYHGFLEVFLTLNPIGRIKHSL